MWGKCGDGGGEREGGGGEGGDGEDGDGERGTLERAAMEVAGVMAEATMTAGSTAEEASTTTEVGAATLEAKAVVWVRTRAESYWV